MGTDIKYADWGVEDFHKSTAERKEKHDFSELETNLSNAANNIDETFEPDTSTILKMFVIKNYRKLRHTAIERKQVLIIQMNLMSGLMNMEGLSEMPSDPSEKILASMTEQISKCRTLSRNAISFYKGIVMYIIKYHTDNYYEVPNSKVIYYYILYHILQKHHHLILPNITKSNKILWQSIISLTAKYLDVEGGIRTDGLKEFTSEVDELRKNPPLTKK